MDDYVTLAEIYIFDSKLFKFKSLNSFINQYKIQEHDVVTLNNKTKGIKVNWIKKNIPLFNLKLDNAKESGFVEVKNTLEKYKIKNFNPVVYNLDSSMVKYFLKNGQRTPYFTQKGHLKIKVIFNDIEEKSYTWLHELLNGKLQAQLDNIDNVLEMVNLNHTPFIKNIDGELVLSNNFYTIKTNDIIVDFKRIADLKKETNLKDKIEDYRCPLFTYLQSEFVKGLKEAETLFKDQLKEVKQDMVIQHLQQKLDQEKYLKDQILTLTQSFIPMTGCDIRRSTSPVLSNDGFCHNSPISKNSLNMGKLKPSKIQ